MKLSTTTVVHAPPTDVWGVVGPRFADAAAWATAVESSEGLPVEGTTPPGAPHSARACTIRRGGRLVEHLIAYDMHDMTLTYVVTEGLQQVARRAALTWTVTPTPEGMSELRIDTEVTPTILGRALHPLVRHLLDRAARGNADDLRRFVEGRGATPPQTVQATRWPSARRAVAWNAVFSITCGALLLAGGPWWARQFGGAPTEVILSLGAGLMSYGMALAWLARRGVTKGVARALAILDAAWVAGVVGVLALTDQTRVAAVAALTTSTAVGCFGVLQWFGQPDEREPWRLPGGMRDSHVASTHADRP
jgi:hypothetical protein